MKRRQHLVLGAFLLLLWSPVYADSGTIIMFANMLHLTVGNLLIALVEALAIKFLFKVRLKPAFFWLLLANFVSAVGGCMGLGTVYDLIRPHVIGDQPLYRIQAMIPIMIVLSYFGSMLLEWPFILAAMRKLPSRLPKSILGTIVAQTVSYLLLIPFYYAASNVMSGVTIHSDMAGTLPNDATVLYVEPKENALYRIDLHGQSRQRVMDLPAKPDFFCSLRLLKKPNSPQWDLFLDDKLLIDSVAANLPIDRCETGGVDGRERMMGPTPHRFANYVDSSDAEKWHVWSDWWYGLRVNGQKLSLDLPYEKPWYVNYATVLPGDRVVFQFGEQIVIMKMDTREIAMLALGECPITIPTKNLGASLAPAATSMPATAATR